MFALATIFHYIQHRMKEILNLRQHPDRIAENTPVDFDHARWPLIRIITMDKMDHSLTAVHYNRSENRLTPTMDSIGV